MAHTVDNVACTVCGCVCDDLRITVDDGRVARAEGACRLAEPWFFAQETRRQPRSTATLFLSKPHLTAQPISSDIPAPHWFTTYCKDDIRA